MARVSADSDSRHRSGSSNCGVEPFDGAIAGLAPHFFQFVSVVQFPARIAIGGKRLSAVGQPLRRGRPRSHRGGYRMSVYSAIGMRNGNGES